MDLTPDENGYLHFPPNTKTYTKLAKDVKAGDLVVTGTHWETKEVDARIVYSVKVNEKYGFVDIVMDADPLGFYFYLELNEEIDLVVKE